MQIETAMSLALKSAGVKTLAERLRELQIRMLVENPASIRQAADAAMLHVDRAPELAFLLDTREHFTKMMFMQLERLREEMARAERVRRKAEAGGAGQPSRDNQGRVARPTTKSPASAGESGEGHCLCDNHRPAALPATNAPASVGVREGGQAERDSQGCHAALSTKTPSAVKAEGSGASQHPIDNQRGTARPTAAMTAVGRQAQKAVALSGLLASITVNNKPLGKAYPIEVRTEGRALLAMGRSNLAMGRFLIQVAKDVPPNDPIGLSRSADDAASIMEKARDWAKERVSDAE